MCANEQREDLTNLGKFFKTSFSTQTQRIFQAQSQKDCIDLSNAYRLLDPFTDILCFPGERARFLVKFFSRI